MVYLIEHTVSVKPETLAWRIHKLTEELEDACCTIDADKYPEKYKRMNELIEKLTVVWKTLSVEAQESVLPIGLRSKKENNHE